MYTTLLLLVFWLPLCTQEKQIEDFCHKNSPTCMKSIFAMTCHHIMSQQLVAHCVQGEKSVPSKFLLLRLKVSANLNSHWPQMCTQPLPYSPKFKELVSSSRLFPFAFTFFKVSIAHLRNLVENTVYFVTVSSANLQPTLQPFLLFNGDRRGAR